MFPRKLCREKTLCVRFASAAAQKSGQQPQHANRHVNVVVHWNVQIEQRNDINRRAGESHDRYDRVHHAKHLRESASTFLSARQSRREPTSPLTT